MFIRSISDQTRNAAQRLIRNERGNVAAIFAISLVPLLGFVGAAIDYSRTTSARSSMKVALDSAALMVSKDLGSNPTMSAAEISAKATNYFNALYTNGDSTPITVTASYTTNTKDGSTVSLTGSGNVPTDFMKMVGFPQLGISGSSTTTWGSTRMRIAMALDVTGSMASSGKLAAMKTAAKSLIDTLSASSRMTEDVYISIIPFAQMVNVGSSNKSATWLKWDIYDDTAGSCTKSRYDNKTDCNNSGYSWIATSRNSWNGCVTDRDQPYDTTNDAATSSSTRYPAYQYNACPESILGMTTAYGSTNIQTLKNKIDALSANGGTNQAIGMAWAWTTLQIGSDPFPAPAKDSNYKYTDAIILLSDGMNTIDRWYGNGSQWSTQVDARQKLLCDNIKSASNNASSTVIYTIQVNTDGDPESAILKSCADTGNFYPTSTASGIAAAFSAIGNSLNKLRVSR